MNWLLIVIAGTGIINSIILLRYWRQIKKICLQLEFIKKHDTNKMVTQDVGNRQITRLTKEINQLLKQQKLIETQFQQKDQALKDMITNVSHDIRTPLTSLNGYFELLKESSEAGEREHYITIIQERVDGLKEILEELFIYTKLQNNVYQFELEEVKLNELLYETMFSFYEEFKVRQIEPDINIPKKSIIITANISALRRVFQNIIKNILIHGVEEMCLQVEQDPDSLHIIFENRVSENLAIDLDHVFERFYKADQARNQNTAGLGLAIAKELVTAMGGEIKAYKNEACFGINICFKL